MINILKRTSFLIILILFFANSHAQISDAQLWTELGVTAKINKKIKLELQQSLRLRQNISQIDKYYTDFAVNYSLTKRIQLGVNYRFEEEKREEGSFSTRHRLAFDASYKYKVKKLTFSLRTRYQTKFYDYYSSETGLVPGNHLRLRLKTSYKIKKYSITPSFSAEVYYATNGISKNNIDKYRFTLGGKYKINKHNRVSLNYRLQNQINVLSPLNLYIIMLAYEYDF